MLGMYHYSVQRINMSTAPKLVKKCPFTFQYYTSLTFFLSLPYFVFCPLYSLPHPLLFILQHIRVNGVPSLMVKKLKRSLSFPSCSCSSCPNIVGPLCGQQCGLVVVIKTVQKIPDGVKERETQGSQVSLNKWEEGHPVQKGQIKLLWKMKPSLYFAVDTDNCRPNRWVVFPVRFLWSLPPGALAQLVHCNVNSNESVRSHKTGRRTFSPTHRLMGKITFR